MQLDDTIKPLDSRQEDAASGRAAEDAGAPGYAAELDAAPGRVTGLEIQQYLTTRRLGRILYSMDQVDSTNRVAQLLADRGAPEGTLVVARSQTAGRGRLGRSWASPPGKGLWFSIVLTPAAPPAIVPQIPLVAAVAVARGLAEAAHIAVSIKWPNDIMIKGRKLCGILAESRTQGDKLTYVILGIGLNTNATREDFPPGLADIATSIFLETGAQVKDIRLLGAILNEIERWYDLWLDKGFEPVRAAWHAQDALAQGTSACAAYGGQAQDTSASGACTPKPKG